MTRIRQRLFTSVVVGLTAIGIGGPAAAAFTPTLGERADAAASTPAIVLASNVVQRPVVDSAGRTVNRLPGRLQGVPPKRVILVCSGGTRNVCRSVPALPLRY